ncbi:hypothetical protein C0995_002318, partial [Termitomyces sp. Mi166
MPQDDSNGNDAGDDNEDGNEDGEEEDDKRKAGMGMNVDDNFLELLHLKEALQKSLIEVDKRIEIKLAL